MTNIAIIGIIYIINLDMFIWYFNQKEQAMKTKRSPQTNGLLYCLLTKLD